MSILDVFRKWDIDLPNDTWFVEYLMESRPEKMCYFSNCPFSSDEKYLQFETFHPGGNKKPKGDYIVLEQKYLNVMLLLWLYNNTFIEYDSWIIENADKYTRRAARKYYNRIKKIHIDDDNYLKIKMNERIEVVEKLTLEKSVRTAMRNLLHQTLFYFEEYEMIVIPHFSCFIVYMNNLNHKKTIKDIVMTEGLYLREYSP